MAAPWVRDSDGTTNSSNVALPTASVGDLLLVWATHTSGDDPIGLPAGWTELFRWDGEDGPEEWASEFYAVVAARIKTGSEGATASFSNIEAAVAISIADHTVTDLDAIEVRVPVWGSMRWSEVPGGGLPFVNVPSVDLRADDLALILTFADVGAETVQQAIAGADPTFVRETESTPDDERTTINHGPKITAGPMGIRKVRWNGNHIGDAETEMFAMMLDGFGARRGLRMLI